MKSISMFLLSVLFSASVFALDDMGKRVEECAFHSDAACVEGILRSPDYDAVENFGNIYSFITWNQTRFLAIFINLPGVDVNHYEPDLTPLYFAIFMTRSHTDYVVPMMLMMKGANPDQPLGERGETPRSLNPALVATLEKALRDSKK